MTDLSKSSPPVGGAAHALRPMQRSRLYERLVERLLSLIHELQLTAGDRLPPERELAAGLGVSRASVRQALVVLEVQGLIEVRHGEGAILLETRPDSTVLSAVRAHTRRLPEIIEAREALEVKIAALAALRRTDEDLTKIKSALICHGARHRGRRPRPGGRRTFPRLGHLGGALGTAGRPDGGHLGQDPGEPDTVAVAA